jgi:hypothetical protein
MYFVLFVNNKGVPGRMIGAMEWEAAVSWILTETKVDREEWTEKLEEDGYCEVVGGTWYILAPEY